MYYISKPAPYKELEVLVLHALVLVTLVGIYNKIKNISNSRLGKTHIK